MYLKQNLVRIECDFYMPPEVLAQIKLWKKFNFLLCDDMHLPQKTSYSILTFNKCRVYSWDWSYEDMGR